MNALSIDFAALGVASAFSWGASDFCGGMAARKSQALIVVLCSQGTGFAVLLALALITHESTPLLAGLAWSLTAGIVALVGLGALYSAFARGHMGVVAPITGVITSALPVLFGMVVQGLPQPIQVAGFALAIAAVAFVAANASGSPVNGNGARNDARTGARTGARIGELGLAALAGACFGTFVILLAQAQHAGAGVFWSLAAARTASVLALSAFLLVRRRWTAPRLDALPLMVGSGVLDAGGTCLYLLSAQASRMDVAGALSSMYPAFTLLLALVLLREMPNRRQIVGVLLSLLAIPMIVGR